MDIYNRFARTSLTIMTLELENRKIAPSNSNIVAIDSLKYKF